jgi:tetratricopeptide (TPR) repeat protein
VLGTLKQLTAVLALVVAIATAGSAAERSAEAMRLTEEARTAFREGDAQRRVASYERGIELAERAIALDPANAEAHYALFLNLGRKSEESGMMSRMRNAGRLRKLLERTIELDPRHAHAWEALGEMLLRLPGLMGGSEADGVRALERAADLDPKWPKPALRLAEHYAEGGDTDKARRFAERARDLARAKRDAESQNRAEDLLAKL